MVGPVAGWFGQVGLGTQVKLEKSVGELVEEGVLGRVRVDEGGCVGDGGNRNVDEVEESNVVERWTWRWSEDEGGEGMLRHGYMDGWRRLGVEDDDEDVWR